MTIRVTAVAQMGYVTIVPLGVPTIGLRVPASVEVVAEVGDGIGQDPVGETAVYTPVHLKAVAMCMDRATRQPVNYLSQSDAPQVGDWVYDVLTLHLTGSMLEGGITPRDLAAIRLPGLMARALRPVVSVVADDGSMTFGATDPDERLRGLPGRPTCR